MIPLQQIENIETTPAGKYDYRLIGTATLADDREVNFVYHILERKFTWISDESYAKAIKDKMEEDSERLQGREPNYDAYDYERQERIEALKLK